MALTVTGRVVPPELRISLFFFSLFMSVGIANGFAGIWFAGRGFSADQIGLVYAVPVLVMLVLNLLVGRLADRAGDWRQVIVLGALMAGIVPFALFWVAGFWAILLVWTLSTVAQQSIVPVADAACMRFCRRRGSDYGVIRSFGTVGYLLVIILSGYLVAWYGGEMFLPLFAALAFVRGLVALGLPNFRAERDAATPLAGASRLGQVMKPWFLLPLVGWAIINATHLLLTAFQGLLFQEQGIEPQTIGLLIAVGAAAEAVMFFSFRRFAGRWSARQLILVSAVVSVLRWTAMAFSPGVGILFALQLLHSLTYALGFLGCMNFIANWTSEDIAAEAQGFFAMLQQATAAIAFFAFGALAASWGAYAYLASAAFAALGAFLIWLSIRLKEPAA
ncbi:MAG: MFS transporter [Allorhizobium sp.]